MVAGEDGAADKGVVEGSEEVLVADQATGIRKEQE